MDKFIELLRESVIVQASLTLLIWGTICYMYIALYDVPEVLVAAGSAILGFYFGTKNAQMRVKG
ncbi:MAG: hypothetical protein AB1744_00935 [Candidatus Zixiibacteriota bacterium]